MFTFRRFLACVGLLSLATLAGCAMLSSDAWQRPSPFTAPPPRPVEKHEIRGGFTVLVDVPGQPSAARVFADLAAFAQQRGFVRQSVSRTAPALAPQRYLLGKIVLDVTYDAAHLSVKASLHSASRQLGRKFHEQFYSDFQKQFAGGYGDGGSVIESDYADD